MSFVNIHTHHLKDEKSIFIKNHTLGKDNEPYVPESNYFSVGIHPWYLQNYQHLTGLLFEYVKSANNIAIGECGLDPFSEFSMDIQKEVFITQVKLAEKFQKPLIIHCVKAYNELIVIKKNSKSSVPWVIHGFNTNKKILEECLKNEMYISVGNNLIMNKSKNYDIIREVPVNRLFVETDEANSSILFVYKQLATILEIPMDYLKEKVYLNFLKVFKLP
jgi:TatD DNase family protein